MLLIPFMSYCSSRFQTIRRTTVEVKVGQVGVGAANPVRIQSMTTSDTQDIAVASQALARLREGASYGICTDCEEDIPFARLQAEPWALRCVDCAGLREAARKRGG